MAVATRGFAGDPPAGAVGSSDLAVEARPVLPDHERAPAPHRVQPGLVVRARPRPRSRPPATSTPAARSVSAPPANAGWGSLDGVDDPAYSGVQQRDGARAGASGLRARLQGDHGGTAARPLPGVAQRDDLGVRTAGEDVPALAGDLPFGIEDDAAHRPGSGSPWRARARPADGAAHRGGLHAVRERSSHWPASLARWRHVRRRRGCAATALAGSSAPKTAEPATSTLAPASTHCTAVSSVTAPVDLDPQLQLATGGQAAHGSDRRQHVRQERLAAEARLDRHDQHQVELGEQLGVRLDRGPRVEGDPGPRPGRVQIAGGAQRCFRRPRREW